VDQQKKLWHHKQPDGNFGNDSVINGSTVIQEKGMKQSKRSNVEEE